MSEELIIRVLKKYADLQPETIIVVGGKRPFFVSDISGSRHNKSTEQLDQRGFPGAVLADQGDPVPWGNVQVDTG